MAESNRDKFGHGETASLDLYWIPLGAGQHVVRVSGGLYEAASALVQRRSRQGLYHSALVVSLDGLAYVIEMAPVPDGDGAQRGVVCEGAVGAVWAARWRVFRYEVRRWPGGTIPDLDAAVGGAVHLSASDVHARRALDLAPYVPPLVWGRDELHVGEMWNSNSVVAWLVEMAGLDARTVLPPEGGRAPGWSAGVRAARRGPRAMSRVGRRLPRSTPSAVVVG